MRCWLAIPAFVSAIACGGPESVTPPAPTQSINADFAGTDDTGAIHVHVDFVQTGRNVALKSPCVPQDFCRIYPYSIAGQAELGSQFAVDIVSATGTFTDPGLTFTVMTANGKTFSFTGTVVQSQQITGTISGPSRPASRIQLDKQ